MTSSNEHSPVPAPSVRAGEPARAESPFLRAPEGARTVFGVTLAAACAPLVAGVVLFGFRSAIVAAISIASCAILERLFYTVTRVPALLGKTHGYLTGVLLALTLPPMVPWYIPVIAAVFAIIVGKCVFGGVGHFLWQPALVGRLAVAVLFPATLSPATWPVLAQSRLLTGDIRSAASVEGYRQWRDTPPPDGADAFLLTPVSTRLAGVSRADPPQYSGLVPRQVDSSTPLPKHPKPTLISDLPPLNDVFLGARPGGIGETAVLVIIVAGLYLMYRGYVKWQLPVCFLLAACAVFIAGPIKFAGPNATTDEVYWPLAGEEWDVGLTYLNYHVLGSEMILAAFFLATETTSRPTTTGGQVIFGLGCGAVAGLLKLYFDSPIPCYLAVLGMNTLTPLIENIWRPRVLGQRRWWGRLFRRV